MWKLLFHRQDFFWRLEQIFFAFLIFALPLGTRKFIFGEPLNNSFFVNFIYLIDILAAVVLALWFFRGGVFDFYLKNKKIFVAGAIFIFIALASGLLGYKGPAFYYLAKPILKIFIGVFLFFYVCHSINHHNKKLLLNVFLISLLLQSLIAIAQFNLQSDLKLKILGESDLSPAIPGVARVNTPDGRFIRAYGTLPHPNILGAFLIAGVALLVYKIIYFKKNLLNFLMIIIFISALFFTFSRSSFLAFTFFILFFGLYIVFKKKALLKKFILLGAIMGLTTLYLAALFFPLLSQRANLDAGNGLQLRKTYTIAAINIIKNNFLLGVGPNNFVREINNYLPQELKLKELWKLQPVHNVFLLIFAETGFLGLLFFTGFLIYIIYSLFKKLSFGDNNLIPIILMLVFSFITLMNFDHYFWTTQQTFFLLCITLGITCRLSMDDSRS